MTTPKRAAPRPESAHEQYRAEVAAYVAAGGDESVQRVITGVHGLARRLNQWYDRPADLDLARPAGRALPRYGAQACSALRPSQLADYTCNVTGGALDDPPPGSG